MIKKYGYSFFSAIIHFVIITLVSQIKINYLWGSAGMLNFSHGLIPLFHMTPGGIIWYFFQLIKTKQIILRLPGMASNLFLYLIYRVESKASYALLLSVLISTSFYFVIIQQRTVLYALPWLFIAILIAYKMISKKKISILEKLIIITYTTHALGTVIYGKFLFFLPNSSYQALFGISILERIVFIFCSYLYFYFIINEKKLLLSALNMLKSIYNALISFFLI
jgi:hypothetical protein